MLRSDPDVNGLGFAKYLRAWYYIAMPIIKVYFDKTKENIKNTIREGLQNPFAAPPPTAVPKPAASVAPTPVPAAPQVQPQPTPQQPVVETKAVEKKPGLPLVKKLEKKLKNPYLYIVPASIGILAAGGFFMYSLFGSQNQLPDLLKSASEKVLGTEEVKGSSAKQLTNDQLLAEVGELYLLPKEAAEVATVVDVEKLRKDEDFFDVAENGDKLLVFKEAKKVILYRPSEKKIVDVAPLLDSVSPSKTPTQTKR